MRIGVGPLLWMVALASGACASDVAEGIDAVAREAGVSRDAGPEDAAGGDPDAEVEDRGQVTPEAGVGAPDASDGGQMDGAPIDASPIDGAAIDSGDLDAGAPDALELDSGNEPCVDLDGDGYGPGCAPGADCDPQDPLRFLEQTIFTDADGDQATSGAGIVSCGDETVPPGFTLTQGPEDCDDARADVHPDHAEQLDCVDHDCDGQPLPLGGGSDGPLVATATSGEALASVLTATASAGQTVLSADGSLFAPADLVLVIAVRGPQAGRFELRHVASTSSTAVVLAEPLSQSFGIASLTWLVQVRQYSDVRVPAGVTVRPRSWIGPNDPGAPGAGIIAWAISGRLIVEQGGAISADGACFPGGRGGDAPRVIGEQGTSHEGVPVRTRAANLTGGGGGSSPSLTNACGGGGGHVTAGGMGQNHPGFSAAGGFGGQSVATSTAPALLCGGGGGGGGLDTDPGPNSRGGNGGAGGGIIVLLAGTVELEGEIRAGGGTGADGIYFGAASPGGGGGGAGGTIVLTATAASGNAGQLLAGGGGGGRGSEAGSGNYRGGTGGLGRIHFDAPAALTSVPQPAPICP